MNIEVIARIGRGELSRAQNEWKALDNPSVHPQYGLASKFSKIYQPGETTADLFKGHIAPLVELHVAGFNVCVALLGETGAGKTLTLAGDVVQQLGLVPLAFERIFDRVEQAYVSSRQDSLLGGMPFPDGPTSQPPPISGAPDSGAGLFPTNATERPRLTMRMFEVHNERIRDLLALSSATSSLLHSNLDDLSLTETPDEGIIVKNASAVRVNRAAEAIALFRHALEHRVNTTTDLGKAQQFSALIIQLELELKPAGSTWPNQSRFTFVELPGTEHLQALTRSDVDDYLSTFQEVTWAASEGNGDAGASGLNRHAGSSLRGALQMRTPPPLAALTAGIRSFSRVVLQLARQPQANRVVDYSDSKLTLMLTEEFGGNCKTLCLFCMKPNQPPEIGRIATRLAEHLRAVRNLPLINDTMTRAVLTQMRARLVRMQHALGIEVGLVTEGAPGGNARRGLVGRGVGFLHMSSPEDIAREIRRLQAENVEVRDRNERLQHRLEELQARYGTEAHHKTDLAAALLMTEEDKLKVSRGLVELELENARLKEELERLKFELTNKTAQFEADMAQMRAALDKLEALQAEYERLAREHRDLADEYVTLKSNYLTVAKENEVLTSKNEELSTELINLVNAKATLIRQLENYRMAGLDVPQLDSSSPEAEIERIKAIVGRLSANPGSKVHKLREVEERFHRTKDLYDKELLQLRNQYDDQQQRLEVRLGSLMKELLDSRKIGQERLDKLSKIEAENAVLKQEREDLKAEKNRAQHKLKEIYEEYKGRLSRYVQEIAEYVDRIHAGGQIDASEGSGRPAPPDAPPARNGSAPPIQKYALLLDSKRKMLEQVKRLMDSIQQAHNMRETQLSDAAQGFRRRLGVLTRKYERLLIEYRKLLQQMDDNHLMDRLELRPYEDILSHIVAEQDVDDQELLSEQEKMIRNLQMKVQNFKIESDIARVQYNTTRGPPGVAGQGAPDAGTRRSMAAVGAAANASTTLNPGGGGAGRVAEEERAAMLARLATLEGQLTEAQGFIQSNMKSYESELDRYRQLLGSGRKRWDALRAQARGQLNSGTFLANQPK